MKMNLAHFRLDLSKIGIAMLILICINPIGSWKDPVWFSFWVQKPKKVIKDNRWYYRSYDYFIKYFKTLFFILLIFSSFYLRENMILIFINIRMEDSILKIRANLLSC